MKRISTICPISMVALVALLTLLLGACSPPASSSAPQSTTYPIASISAGTWTLEELEKSYRDSGASDVVFVRNGEVDEEHVIVISAASNKKQTQSSTKSHEGATITVTVTSDTVVPDVIGKDPLQASTDLMSVGFEVEPYLTSYHAPTHATDENPATTVVSATSLPAGETARVGTKIEVIYTGSLEGYS